MQEIIVYRNPMEAAMWHSLSNGELFPVLCGIIVFFATFLFTNAVMNKIWGSWGKAAAMRTNAALVFGALSGIMVIWKML